MYQIICTKSNSAWRFIAKSSGPAFFFSEIRDNKNIPEDLCETRAIERRLNMMKPSMHCVFLFRSSKDTIRAH
jgi:hypothetical protein